MKKIANGLTVYEDFKKTTATYFRSLRREVREEVCACSAQSPREVPFEHTKATVAWTLELKSTLLKKSSPYLFSLPHVSEASQQLWWDSR